MAPAGFRPGVSVPLGPTLIIRQINGNWQAEGYGEMRCVTQCAFFSNGGNADVRWVSQDFLAVAMTPFNGGNGFNDQNMWGDDAMALMTSVDYAPANLAEVGLIGPSAEYARVEQSGPDNTGWIVARASTHQDGATLAVWAYSFFVGRPHTGHHVFYQEFELNGLGDIPLIPDTQGICTFRSVQGVYESSFPNIVRTGGLWRLRILGWTNLATAQVTCFKFNQNQP